MTKYVEIAIRNDGVDHRFKIEAGEVDAQELTKEAMEEWTKNRFDYRNNDNQVVVWKWYQYSEAEAKILWRNGVLLSASIPKNESWETFNLNHGIPIP